MRNTKFLFPFIVILLFVSSCADPKNRATEESINNETSSGESMTIDVDKNVIELLNNKNVKDISDYKNFDYLESKSPELYQLVFEIDNLTNLEEINKSLLNRRTISLADSLNATYPTSRNHLDSGLKTYYALYDGKKDAGIKVPFLNTNLGKEEKLIQTYYLETKKVNIDNEEKIYGCGYSLVLHIVKHKKGLNISDLPSLAASVQLNNNKNQVFYSLETHGITGQEIVKYFNPIINEKFDVGGFAEMKKNIFGLHKALSDTLISKKLKFTPQDLTDVIN